VTANAPIMEERIFIEGEQYYAMAMAMTIQCNAMQCNTIQCNAMQYNTMQCNAMHCNVIQSCSGIVASSKVLKLTRNRKIEISSYMWMSTEFKMHIR